MKDEMYLGLLIFTASLVVGCAGIPNSPQKTTADIINDNKELIRKNPNDADAHYMLAFTYDRLGQFEKAIKPWKELIRLRPANAKAHYGLGNAYENLGRNNEAVAEYKEALRIFPDFFLARND